MVSYRGSSLDQHPRYQAKAQTQNVELPEILHTKISIENVSIKRVSKWIDQYIESLLGFPDEILASTISNMIEDKTAVSEILATAKSFLGKDSDTFMERLW